MRPPDALRLAVLAACAALFLWPIVAYGELGAWRFGEPVSGLAWDEAGQRDATAGDRAETAGPDALGGSSPCSGKRRRGRRLRRGHGRRWRRWWLWRWLGR